MRSAPRRLRAATLIVGLALAACVIRDPNTGEVLVTLDSPSEVLAYLDGESRITVGESDDGTLVLISTNGTRYVQFIRKGQVATVDAAELAGSEVAVNAVATAAGELAAATSLGLYSVFGEDGSTLLLPGSEGTPFSTVAFTGDDIVAGTSSGQIYVCSEDFNARAPLGLLAVRGTRRTCRRSVFPAGTTFGGFQCLFHVSGTRLVYAGTAGGGAALSQDGGATFSSLAGPPSGSYVYQFATFDLNKDGIVDSRDRVYAATSQGLYGGPVGGSSLDRYVEGNVGGIGVAPPSAGSGRPGLSSSPVLVASVTGEAARVLVSSDGSTFTESPAGPAARFGGSLAVTGGAAPAVYLTTNEGLYRSIDGGASWAREPAAPTATVRSFDAPSPSPGSPGSSRLYAGTSRSASSLIVSSDGGATWSPIAAPLDGIAARAVAHLGDNVVFAGEDGIYRSADAGATFTKGVSGVPATATFTSLLAHGSTLFGGTQSRGSVSPGGVYRSADGGASFTYIAPGIPAAASVECLASKGSLVLAGTDNTSFSGPGGVVYRSTDGGTTWAAGGIVPRSNVLFLRFTSHGLFAGGSGSATDHVYRSTDDGLTWTLSATGLDRRVVYALAEGPDALYAGTAAGLYRSTDGGGSWGRYPDELSGVGINALAVAGERLLIGTSGASLRSLPLSARAARLVPIVLDVATSSARFTTELVLTNRGSRPADLTLRYTAALGSGSGTASDRLAAGEQKVIPDALTYLRGLGVPIPSEGAQGGTLLVTFQGISDPSGAAVSARTTAATGSPQPAGSAGLAYAGLDPAQGSRGRLTVYGLRSNVTDRSNLAVYSTSEEPVTLKITAYSGDTGGAGTVVAEAETLPAYGWRQLNGILDGAGIANGYVTVERISSTGAFGAYGVVNDNGTNDGSFLDPRSGEAALPYLNVPVLVETGAFQSELILGNSGSTSARLRLTYRESLSPASGAGGSAEVTLPPGRQRIVPDALAFLRGLGIPIGDKGAGSYAGSLHVAVEGASVAGVYVGARTASLSPASGQFGLFTPPLYAGSESLSSAYVYGLRSDASNRSNVAAANTGSSEAGAITLELQAYDGDAGGAARGAPDLLSLQPGQWSQVGSFLATKGVTNGWVKVTRTSGSAPFLAYGVINDGGQPGQRTGDGAYVAMRP